MAEPETIEKLTDVLRLYAEGVTIQEACKKVGVSKMSFFRHAPTHPDLGEMYLIARACHVQCLADETIHIADTEKDAAKARNRINSRQWMAERLMPAMFGPKQQIEIEHKLSLKDALNQGNARLVRAKRAPVIEHSAQDTDLIEEVQRRATDTQSEDLPDWLD